MNKHQTQSVTTEQLRTTGIQSPIDTSTSPGKDKEDSDDAGVGYKLCGFCRGRGIAQSNPESVCECTAITRSSARGFITGLDDLAMRIAEHAVIEMWSLDGGTDTISVTRSHVGGGVREGDGSYKRDIKVWFEGSLWNNIDEVFTCEYGQAEMWSIQGDGSIRIGVTLTDEITE